MPLAKRAGYGPRCLTLREIIRVDGGKRNAAMNVAHRGTGDRDIEKRRRRRTEGNGVEAMSWSGDTAGLVVLN